MRLYLDLPVGHERRRLTTPGPTPSSTPGARRRRAARRLLRRRPELGLPPGQPGRRPGPGPSARWRQSLRHHLSAAGRAAARPRDGLPPPLLGARRHARDRRASTCATRPTRCSPCSPSRPPVATRGSSARTSAPCPTRSVTPSTATASSACTSASSSCPARIGRRPAAAQRPPGRQHRHPRHADRSRRGGAATDIALRRRLGLHGEDREVDDTVHRGRRARRARAGPPGRGRPASGEADEDAVLGRPGDAARRERRRHRAGLDSTTSSTRPTRRTSRARGSTGPTGYGSSRAPSTELFSEPSIDDLLRRLQASRLGAHQRATEETR